MVLLHRKGINGFVRHGTFDERNAGEVCVFVLNDPIPRAEKARLPPGNSGPLPLIETNGASRGLRPTLVAHSGNFLQDSCQLLCDPLISKPQNLDASLFDLAVANSIGPFCAPRVMNPTIQFD
jgi:hypothetical protein